MPEHFSSVLEGRADVVRGLAVENDEAVVDRPGVEDRKGRALRDERVDAVLREPVAGGVDGHCDALEQAEHLVEALIGKSAGTPRDSTRCRTAVRAERRSRRGSGAWRRTRR